LLFEIPGKTYLNSRIICGKGKDEVFNPEHLYKIIYS